MANILTEIIEYKRNIEVPNQKKAQPLSELESIVKSLPDTLNFEKALATEKPIAPDAANLRLIAEVKKASPSKGLLCPDFDPAQLASAYQQAGAAALSVLTDTQYFMGQLDYIALCKNATDNSVPVLRKDFMVDPYQVVQARAYKADAILLIMAALNDVLAKELFDLATELQLAALVEVHNQSELERALQLGARIIGVNNRDLTTFHVDLQTTTRLARLLPSDFNGVLVSESGIGKYTEITELEAARVNAVLIGETLVKAASTENGLNTGLIGQKVREMFAAS